MSIQLLEQLEEKVDKAIEVIELLRLQVEELEEKKLALQNENTGLKSRQTQWEHSLASLLTKLDGASLNTDKLDARTVERFAIEEADAIS
jgi:cell division protein ZapB